MALPHPAIAVAAAALVGGGSLVATLAQDHGVPERAARAYITAAHAAPCPLDYRILVGIGAVETGHGTHGGASLGADGKLTKVVFSSAGAQGPMQFMPDTWRVYATDGDGDGVADVNDIDDAAAAAAKLLCASNVDENVTDAVGSYNGGAGWQNYAESRSYVAQVDERVAALPADDGNPVSNASHAAQTLPDKKGRICGVAEWTAETNDCTAEAKAKAAYLWARLGKILGEGDTPKLQAMWARLNGSPTTGVTMQPIAASTAGLKGDIAGLPGSAGLNEDFATRLARMVSFAPGAITISQGFRTPEDALQKWKAALAKYGSEDEARRWVAKTTVDASGKIDCGSNHCTGLAADLEFEDGLTEQWAHANAARWQLTFPLANESWHIEPEGIR